MTDRICEAEGCDNPHKARGLCRKHYNAATRADKPLPTSKGKRRSKVIEVVAEMSWKDKHPLSPGGQRIAQYRCPVCKGAHLVAWLPFDEHPGQKIATCRRRTATATDPGQAVVVLAPPVERQYDDEPVTLVPGSFADLLAEDDAADLLA